MINFRRWRIATAAAILTMLAAPLPSPRRRALSIPSRRCIAASHSQTQR